MVAAVSVWWPARGDCDPRRRRVTRTLVLSAFVSLHTAFPVKKHVEHAASSCSGNLPDDPIDIGGVCKVVHCDRNIFPKAGLRDLWDAFCLRNKVKLKEPRPRRDALQVFMI